MARSFAVGLVLVVVVAAVAIILLRPGGVPPTTSQPVAAAAAGELDMTGVRTTRRAATGMRPPPTRENLTTILCSGRVVLERCTHRLMELYRACGTDLAHPRTLRCDAEMDRVRSAPD